MCIKYWRFQQQQAFIQVIQGILSPSSIITVSYSFHHFRLLFSACQYSVIVQTSDSFRIHLWLLRDGPRKNRIFLDTEKHDGKRILNLTSQKVRPQYTVNMLLVDKFLSTGIWSTDYCRKIFIDTTRRRHSTSLTSILSKFFRRHDISSTQNFVDKHFVDTALRQNLFVDTNMQKSKSFYEL